MDNVPCFLPVSLSVLPIQGNEPLLYFPTWIRSLFCTPFLVCLMNPNSSLLVEHVAPECLASHSTGMKGESRLRQPNSWYLLQMPKCPETSVRSPSSPQKKSGPSFSQACQLLGHSSPLPEIAYFPKQSQQDSWRESICQGRTNSQGYWGYT